MAPNDQPKGYLVFSNSRKKVNSRVKMPLSPTLRTVMLCSTLVVTLCTLVVVPLTMIGIFSEFYFGYWLSVPFVSLLYAERFLLQCLGCFAQLLDNLGVFYCLELLSLGCTKRPTWVCIGHGITLFTLYSFSSMDAKTLLSSHDVCMPIRWSMCRVFVARYWLVFSVQTYMSIEASWFARAVSLWN